MKLFKYSRDIFQGKYLTRSWYSNWVKYPWQVDCCIRWRICSRQRSTHTVTAWGLLKLQHIAVPTFRYDSCFLSRELHHGVRSTHTRVFCPVSISWSANCVSSSQGVDSVLTNQNHLNCSRFVG